MSLPAFLRSIRFRLALTYSVVVFGLAFLVIAGVNFAISQTLDEQPVSQRVEFVTFVQPDGSLLFIEDRYRSQLANLERFVNLRAQDNLRRFSLWALLGMFPASIALGWMIADRALRPIGRISSVARDIQASDLSRRIDLGGPDDELRELADTFDEMLDRVEAGISAQTAFIEDTSHELRNPLAVMRTNLDVALADPNAEAATLREAAEVVRRTLDRTSRTVNDLITFARHEMPIGTVAPVDLLDVVSGMAAEYRPTAADKSVAIELAASSQKVPTIEADQESIKQAVANLIRNAVAVAPHGTTVDLTVGTMSGWLFVKVSDHGPGIADADHARVFERNWSKSVGGKEGGSGLGLAIARQMAEAQGGTVTLLSSSGGGAEFALWLPANPNADLVVISPDRLHHRA